MHTSTTAYCNHCILLLHTHCILHTVFFTHCILCSAPWLCTMYTAKVRCHTLVNYCRFNYQHHTPLLCSSSAVGSLALDMTLLLSNIMIHPSCGIFCVSTVWWEIKMPHPSKCTLPNWLQNLTAAAVQWLHTLSSSPTPPSATRRKAITIRCLSSSSFSSRELPLTMRHYSLN